MTATGIIITPHGSIESDIANAYTKTFTLELVADTAKTLADTDFGSIDTSANSYAVVLDVIRSTRGAEVKMHKTAAADTITTTEATTRFGPLLKKGIGDRIYPISVPFQYDSGTSAYLTFIADNDSTIIGRVLQLT